MILALKLEWNAPYGSHKLDWFFGWLFTTIAFNPQVVNTWKTRSANDISLLMFLLFSSGVPLWLFYGLLMQALPIIIANSITLSLALKIKDLPVEQRAMWILYQ